MSEPLFKIGQVVRHLKNGYRGVIHDVDVTFQLSEEWYNQAGHSHPPKDKPWYRVLVHGAVHETYVAERHLAIDDSGNKIEHPGVPRYFDEFRGDHYARTRNLN